MRRRQGRWGTGIWIAAVLGAACGGPGRGGDSGGSATGLTSIPETSSTSGGSAADSGDAGHDCQVDGDCGPDQVCVLEVIHMCLPGCDLYGKACSTGLVCCPSAYGPLEYHGAFGACCEACADGFGCAQDGATSTSTSTSTGVDAPAVGLPTTVRNSTP